MRTVRIAVEILSIMTLLSLSIGCSKNKSKSEAPNCTQTFLNSYNELRLFRVRLTVAEQYNQLDDPSVVDMSYQAQKSCKSFQQSYAGLSCRAYSRDQKDTVIISGSDFNSDCSRLNEKIAQAEKAHADQVQDLDDAQIPVDQVPLEAAPENPDVAERQPRQGNLLVTDIEPKSLVARINNQTELRGALTEGKFIVEGHTLSKNIDRDIARLNSAVMKGDVVCVISSPNNNVEAAKALLTKDTDLTSVAISKFTPVFYDLKEAVKINFSDSLNLICFKSSENPTISLADLRVAFKGLAEFY